MATVEELKVRLTADNRDLKMGLQDSQAALGNFGEKSSRSLALIGKAGRAAAIGVTAIGAAGALGFGVKLAADMEQAAIGFETMLGSAEEADAFLRELAEFSAKTPFEFQGVVDGARRLMAMGFAAEDVLPTLTNVGDAVSAMGGGTAMIDAVTRALGQMNAKGTVSAQEMLQLAEAGIPAWEMLAEKIGVTIPEAMKLVENRAVEASTFFAAFEEGVATRFGGAMEKQSKTLSGQFSTLKDTIGLALAGAAAPLVEGLTNVLPKATTMLSSFAENVGPTLEAGMAKIGPTVSAAFEALPGVLSGMVEFLSPLVAAFRGLFDQMVSTVKTVATAFIDGLGGNSEAQESLMVIGVFLRDVLIVVIKALGMAIQLLTPVLKVFAGALGDIVGWIADVISWLRGLDDAFKGLLDIDLYEVGKNIIDGLWRGLTDKWNSVKDGVTGIADSLKSKFTGALGINSPSRVFRQYGEYITDGLSEGLSAGMRQLPSLTVDAPTISAQRGSQTPSASSAANVTNHFTFNVTAQDGADFGRKFQGVLEREARYMTLSSRRPSL